MPNLFEKYKSGGRVSLPPNKSGFIQPPTPEEQKKSREEGVRDGIKEQMKQKVIMKEKFESMVKTSDRELFRLSTIFPFDLFPDEVVIDVDKVSVITGVFFFSKRIHSVFIQDITDVFVDSTLIFATLEIVDSGFVENSIKIKPISRTEAMRARKIIQGLIVAKKQEIDLSKILDLPDLVNKLEKLGETKTDKE